MAFDELYDGGRIRPLYEKYFAAYSKLTIAQRKVASSCARKRIHGDADFLPLVRLMSSSEYDQLSAGVRQRGRALQLFLTDHYFGDRSYARKGILKKSQVERILGRYSTSANQPPLRPENIQFWYAPDLVRDEQGRFRVIEDNVGFVGGIGDLYALADASRDLGISLPASRHPRTFYRRMIERYEREARKHGGGKTILLAYPKASRLNHEDQRFEEILSELDIESVTDFRKLKVREDGLFHGKDRVGFVIVYVNSEEIDPAGSSTYRIANFWKAVSEGQLGVSYSPGLEFIGDKNFCPKVEALVEFYLKEKCILPSLPTIDLESTRSLARVRTQREDWVIKLGRGQSGESVWVGKHLTPAAWTKLMQRVSKKPEEFIAQRFTEPSRFLGHAVDLRPLALITPGSEIVSPIPWARAAKSEKSKTNISCGGLLAPVAVGGTPIFSKR